MRINSRSQKNLLIQEKHVERVNKFCYLGSMVTRYGRCQQSNNKSYADIISALACVEVQGTKTAAV